MGLFLYPPPNNAPIVIINDGGGIVEEFLNKAQQYNLEGRRVEIRGSCRSACVIALSVKNVCVAPGAIVKAHLPYNKYGGQVRTDYIPKMLGTIPENIRNYLEPRLQVNYTPATTLDYEKLRSFGIADCGNKKPVVAESKQTEPIKIGKPTIKILNPIEAILRVFR
jgi:hypothetical protein